MMLLSCAHVLHDCTAASLQLPALLVNMQPLLNSTVGQHSR